MPGIFLQNSNIISPLGWNTSENLQSVLSGRGGIKIVKNRELSPEELPLALMDWKELNKRFNEISQPGQGKAYTRFEKVAILSMHEALKNSDCFPADPGTVLILSTTKGNVDLLDGNHGFAKDRLTLWSSAALIADFFGMKNKPVLVSNACVSGVAAMLVGRQLIDSARYNNAIVLGADLVSRFIVSGFQSFLSLSKEACRPFDRDRDGLTLGEAAATVILSNKPGNFELVSGSSSNDANHISGPSRDGEGLLIAINSALKGQDKPGAISAHGTATPYNDEMESIALERAALNAIPVNSLKGYFGHTLGAAGLLESIVNLEALKQGSFPGTKGFSSQGVSGDILISNKSSHLKTSTLLKTASGFGGSNAVALFKIRTWS